MTSFIALYGGSFNLSTRGHRAIGEFVRDVFQPDAVWYLVSPQNPHKSTDHMADFKHRLEMAKLNVMGEPKLVVTRIEYDISKKTGSTASSDTLRELIARYPDIRFAWVLGADAFVKMHTWHNYETILNHVPIIVMPRAGYTEQVPTCPAAQHAACPQLTNPEQVKTRLGWYLAREFPEGNGSATQQRDLINQGLAPNRDYVHPAVSRYITEHGVQF